MTKIERFLIALMFALLTAGVTLVMAQAKMESAAPSQQQREGCFTCHPQFQEAWASGAHGHATSDSLFNQSWTSQGRPGACLVCHVTGYDPATGTWQKDGVACEACHSPVNMNHPQEPMPVDHSTELCGHCHSDVRFGWQEWQASTHYQRNMTCTVCHDPHSAGLKTVKGAEDQGPSALCINCHREYGMDFPYSKHSQAGIKCVDCHLRHYGASGGREVHTMPDHSFNANLASCNTCHANQMHSSIGEASSAEPEPITQPSHIELPSNGALADQPAPVSPLGFAGLAGLLGLAGGMVLSPWLEKLYRRLNNSGRGK